jgi:hypothetical protein
MNASICSLHPGAAATHRCEGCERFLCPACVQSSHALLLCRTCGERALPLSDAHGATVKEVRRHEAVDRPYALGEAFFYPFRGPGKYMFLATLVSLAFVNVLMIFGFSCFPLVIAAAFGALLIALQFKIADTSARGDTELPDWPEYFEIVERVLDVLTYGFLALLQFAPLVAYAYLFASPEKLLTTEPNPLFWLGFAICAWVGAAFWVVAFGAAGHYGRGAAFRLDLHVRALFGAKHDGLVFTNIVFPLGIAVLTARALLLALPFVGAAVSGVLGAYWLFLSAHLAGLIVRRNLRQFDRVFG